MTFDDLATEFLTWGKCIKPDQYENFKKYLREMMHRNRVMFITNANKVEAVVMFHLTNNYDKLYKKSMWAIPEDEPDGSQIYIDKMICKAWNPPLRRKIQQTIEDYFPQVKVGYYHRAPYDRCVRIYRRGTRLCTT